MLFRIVIECPWLSACLEIFKLVFSFGNGEKLHRAESGEDGERSCCYQFFFVMSRSIVMVQSKHHSKVQVFPDKQPAHICINMATISLLLLYWLRQHRRWNHWHITVYSCWLFSCCCWKQHLFVCSANRMFGVLREHVLVSVCCLVEILNVHALPEKLRSSVDTIHIINDCL
jgi:hypothetical protein